MTSTKLTFDQANQERTIDIFAASDYTKRYFRLGDSFQEDGNINGPRLNLARTADIFRNAGIQVQLDKRFARSRRLDLAWETRCSETRQS